MKFTTKLVLLGCLGLGGTIFLSARETRDPDADARTTYFASGQLESKIEYHEGKRQGRAERWHKNGQKMAEGQYQDGRMEGAWQFWNLDGSSDVERSGTYQDGARVEGASQAALDQAENTQGGDAAGGGVGT